MNRQVPENKSYDFINPNRHNVSVLGPKKEKIEFKPHQKIRLSSWYQKYCPKYLVVTGNAITTQKVLTPKSDIKKPTMTRPARNVVVVRENTKGKRKRIVPKTIRRIIDDSRVKSRNRGIRKSRTVGKRSHIGARATEFFKKAVELTQTPISDNIGVGILSFNRLHAIQRLLESIRKTTNMNKTTVFVSDESTDDKVKRWLKVQKDIVLIDNETRIGIAGNTNRLMRCLDRFKYKILLNDDVEILRAGWEKLYPSAMRKAGYHHFCMRQDGVYGADRSDGHIATVVDVPIQTIKSKPHGAIMAFDDAAFEKVGFFDEAFGVYGMEHIDWSNRVSLSGIQPAGYHDVVGAEQFFKITKDKSSIKDNAERSRALHKGKARFNEVCKNKSRIYVKATDHSKVPEVSYIVPFSGTNRSKSLQTVINNVRAQRFPRIEIVLVEQADKPNAATECLDLGPIKYVFDEWPQNRPFTKAVSFNKGAAAASCKKIVLHDADMLVVGNYTTEVMKRLEKNESCHIGAYVAYMDVNSTILINKRGQIEKSMSCERVVNYFEGGSMGCHHKAYFTIGGFNENFVGYGCEDCEFYERLKAQTKFLEDRQFTFVHLQHGRTRGWEGCHERNKQLHKQIQKIKMDKRIKLLHADMRVRCPKMLKKYKLS